MNISQIVIKNCNKELIMKLIKISIINIEISIEIVSYKLIYDKNFMLETRNKKKQEIQAKIEFGFLF